MKWLVLVGIAGGCGFQVSASSTTGDGGPDGTIAGDDDASPDASNNPCATAPAWSDGLTPTSTIYISMIQNGPGDGTMAHPYLNFAQAKPAMTPGVRVVIAAGMYAPENINDLTGTATAPIWIEGPASGPRAVIMGTMGLHFVRPKYLVISHLDFTGQTTTALNLDDGGDRTMPAAHHVTLTDVDVSMVTATAIQLAGVTDVVLRNSRVTAAANGVLLVGVHRAIVHHVAIQKTSVAAFEVSGGASDIELRQSHLVNNAGRAVWLGGTSTEMEFRPPLVATGNAEASDIRVLDNIIDSGTALVTCSLCTGALVGANYLLGGGTTTYVVRMINDHGTINGHTFVNASGLRLIDNAIEVSSNPYGVRMETGADCSACVFDHNLWFESDNPADSTPTFPVPETNSVYGKASGYTPAGDLCSGGAAIGVGTALTGAEGTFAGACRGTPPSIGPSEPTTGC